MLTPTQYKTDAQQLDLLLIAFLLLFTVMMFMQFGSSTFKELFANQQQIGSFQ